MSGKCLRLLRLEINFSRLDAFYDHINKIFDRYTKKLKFTTVIIGIIDMLKNVRCPLR